MFAVKKRLDNAFDSCSNQGQAREFSLWWWTQASHSPKETESGRRFWPFHPIEQGLWGPSWYNNGLLIPDPEGRCTSPNTALVGQSGHHSWNSKQLRWIESHSWCPDWPTRAVLGGTPTLRVGYYLNTDNTSTVVNQNYFYILWLVITAQLQEITLTRNLFGT